MTRETTVNFREKRAWNMLADIKGEHPGWETMYEDYMIEKYGVNVVNLLREFHLIESCAVIDGRRLYAL